MYCRITHLVWRPHQNQRASINTATRRPRQTMRAVIEMCSDRVAHCMLASTTKQSSHYDFYNPVETMLLVVTQLAVFV